MYTKGNFGSTITHVQILYNLLLKLADRNTPPQSTSRLYLFNFPGDDVLPPQSYDLQGNVTGSLGLL